METMTTPNPIGVPMTCTPCENAETLGWWGPDHKGTHCRGCHRSWTGLGEGHCTVCHLHFGPGGQAWDVHFDGDRHRSLAELTGLRSEAGEPRFKVVVKPSGPVVVGARGHTSRGASATRLAS